MAFSIGGEKTDLSQITDKFYDIKFYQVINDRIHW